MWLPVLGWIGVSTGYLLSFAAVFRVVTQRSLLRSRFWGRHATLLPTNGCFLSNSFPFVCLNRRLTNHNTIIVLNRANQASAKNVSRKFSWHEVGIWNMLIREIFRSFYSYWRLNGNSEESRRGRSLFYLFYSCSKERKVVYFWKIIDWLLQGLLNPH